MSRDQAIENLAIKIANRDWGHGGPGWFSRLSDAIRNEYRHRAKLRIEADAKLSGVIPTSPQPIPRVKRRSRS